MIVIPSGLLSGGTTGLSQVINHFTFLNVGLLYFIINVPLLVLGYIFLGKRFSFYTIISVLLLSIFLFFIPVKNIWTDDILLSALFGGCLSSLGSGIVLRQGGSQGGIDILSRVISKYRDITIGKMNLIINGCIVIFSGFIFGSQIALYTVIYIFVSSKTSAFILNHVDHISMLVITDKGKDVNTAINKTLQRGTTNWNAEGGYTKNEKTVLYCVIMKGELKEFKRLVKKADSKAFITIVSTQSVIGRFHQIW